MRISDWSSDVCSSDLTAFEPGFPEAPLRTIDYVDPGVNERSEELFEFRRRVDQLGTIVLQLPLRPAQHDREVGTGAPADRGYYFGREGGALGDAAAKIGRSHV